MLVVKFKRLSPFDSAKSADISLQIGSCDGTKRQILTTRRKQEHSMSLECMVIRPGQGNPETYRFVTVSRVGEGITLPGHYDNFVVESVDHMAREIEDRNPPKVQMHLCALVENGARAR
jgi:hypothetical protein